MLRTVSSVMSLSMSFDISDGPGALLFGRVFICVVSSCLVKGNVMSIRSVWFFIVFFPFMGDLGLASVHCVCHDCFKERFCHVLDCGWVSCAFSCGLVNDVV